MLAYVPNRQKLIMRLFAQLHKQMLRYIIRNWTLNAPFIIFILSIDRLEKNLLDFNSSVPGSGHLRNCNVHPKICEDFPSVVKTS